MNCKNCGYGLKQSCGDFEKIICTYEEGECEKITELENQIEKMQCCENCVHFDFNEPNYCHKGVYRERQYVCGEWCFGN